MFPPVGRGCFAAVDAALACRGRLVVTGMGKSGHIGRKIAATLAPPARRHFSCTCRGCMAIWGMITGDDMVCWPQPGETAEVVALLPALRRSK